MSQPNQFTRAEEQGLPKPTGANQFTTGKRTKHDESTRDKMRAEKLAARLYAYAASETDDDGKEVVMDQSQIAAAKILIDKGKPSLQAVEQTQVSEYESMSEEEIVEQVRSLITLHPGLIERLGIKPQLVSPSDTDPAAHNTHDICTKAA